MESVDFITAGELHQFVCMEIRHPVTDRTIRRWRKICKIDTKRSYTADDRDRLCAFAVYALKYRDLKTAYKAFLKEQIELKRGKKDGNQPIDVESGD